MNIANTKPHLLFAVIVLSLTACQSMPENKMQAQSTAEILQMLDESIESNIAIDADAKKDGDKLPGIVSDALMPKLNLDLRPDMHQSIESRFDLAVEDTPLQIFYMSLVKGTPYNMVVHPGVSGKISINLKNVTVVQAMDVVRSIYGVDYRQTDMGFEVLANELQTRLFKINYLNVRRNGASQINVTSGQITTSNSGNSEDTSKNSSSDSNETETSTGSVINTKSTSNFWQELEATIKTFIPESDDHKVIINPQSGIIVVRAMPKELHDIADYLEQTQIIVKRQVILEAKILEVELNEGFQTGINWSALSDGKGDTAVFGQTGGGSIFGGSGVSEIQGNTGVLDPGNFDNLQGTNVSAFGGVFSLALNIGDFTAFIEALETQGDVHVLSSPRVSTINNQKAVIKVGSDEFFITGISAETLDSATSGLVTTIDVDMQPFFSGVALDVTPQINENNEVTLHVHPSVSEIKEKIKQIGISTTDTLNIPMASSTIRESDSIVSAKSGQVIVIGGLMQNISQDNNAGVPFLGGLPFIGGLFKHKQKIFKKSELVILLKPIVVENDETWTREIKRSRQAVDQISGFHNQ